MSNQRILSGSIALTKMQSAIITTKKGAKCVLLPIEGNFLTEKDGAVYLNISVVVREEVDQYGQNGFISQKLDSAKYRELGSEKAKEIKLPILGNIKDFSKNQNDSAGATEFEKPINPEDSDDLPW
jgi:hypothetical protein